MNNDTKLTINQQFSISPARLFTLLTTPEYIEQWFSPHDSIAIKVMEFDFSIGGDYKLAYTLPDGTNTELHGQFIQIEKPNLISFSWEWQEPDSHAGIKTTVSWLLKEINNKTELTVIHEGANSQFYERHKIGWSGSLDRLASLISMDKLIKE